MPAKAGIWQYIDYFYHERIKLKLKGLGSIQYQIQVLAFWFLIVQHLGALQLRGDYRVSSASLYDIS